MSKGTFVWYDYMTNDVEKAIAFYGETVGWKAAPWGDDGYQMFMVGEEAVGGVMQLPDEAAASGAPPHWMSYVEVDDVDAVAKRTADKGGEVLRAPWDLPEVGRITILQDPQGGAFAAVAFEGDGMTPVAPETPGAFAWAELMTTDHEAAFDFYSDIFDWKKGDTMEVGEGGTYQLFETGGPGGGMMNLPDEMGDTPYWLYYVTTDDIDAAAKRVQQNGGKLLNGPMEIPGGGRVAQLVDNQGGAFALYEGAN